MTGVSVSAVAATHRGRLRQRNEDAVGVAGWRATPEAIPAELHAVAPLMAVVADGAGGHPAGDHASRTVVDYLLAREQAVSTPELLAKVIAGAHEELHLQMSGVPDRVGMGSTVAAVMVTSDSVIVGNVGDSKIYELIDGELVQLSVDDNPARPDWAGDDWETSTLTQMLGGAPTATVAPHVDRYALEPGLAFLLCSDGLTACVDEAAIAATVGSANGDSRSAAYQLIQRALVAGAPDNVSIALLRIGEQRGVYT